MLLVALLLLLVAAALLVISFVTANTLWAWGSIAVSALAAVALVVRWFRLRRVRAASAGRHRDPEESAAPPSAAAAPSDEDESDGAQVPPAGGDAAVAAAPAPEGTVDPDEEDTDAADLLVVSELDDEVVVVDEHPRYHLAACSWLARRTMEPLPVREARELGFTPCSRCGPDAVLAQRHRAGRPG